MIPAVQNALLAVVKGKGKGGQKGASYPSKGSDKGKGKGGKGSKGGKGKGGFPPRPFSGKCHNCDEIGHYARDCPHPRRQQIGAVEPMQQSWYGGHSSVTLCVTDSVFTGYRQNRKSVPSPVKFHPTPTSTKFPITMIDEVETSANEIDIKLDSQVHFPMPKSSVKAKPRHKVNPEENAQEAVSKDETHL